MLDIRSTCGSVGVPTCKNALLSLPDLSTISRKAADAANQVELVNSNACGKQLAIEPARVNGFDRLQEPIVVRHQPHRKEPADLSLNSKRKAASFCQRTLRGASDSDRICADGVLFAL